jgi:hypothetical protein
MMHAARVLNGPTYARRIATTTDHLKLLSRHGIPLEHAVAEQQTAIRKHNALATALYAGSIERAARRRQR